MPDQWWVTFGANLLPQALSSLAGATAGAGLAFRYARKQAAEDRAVEERDRRARAGNLAMFTLIRMYGTLHSFYDRRVRPWGNSPLHEDPETWYQMPTGGELSLEDISFDFNSLAFLLKSAGESPSLPMRLDGQVELSRRLVDAIRRRSDLHEREIQPRLDKLQMSQGVAAEKLEGILGVRLAENMKRSASEIRRLVFKGLYDIPPLGLDLYKQLKKQLPGESFIAFPDLASFVQKHWTEEWPFRDAPPIP